MDVPTSNAGASSQPQSSNTWSGASWNGSSQQPYQQQQHHPSLQLQARPSLPTLHTRSSFLDGYEQFDNSPVEGYIYGSAPVPRQDSLNGTYGSVEDYRPWATTGALSAPVTASYYEQQYPAYSFGTLQAPACQGYPQPSSARLPSVTADSLLNMSSLHSSLPLTTQTVQERRLPVPYTPLPQYQPASYVPTELPEIRSLGSFSEPRVQTHGISSRNSMPWSIDNNTTTPRMSSVSSATSPGGLPSIPALQQSTTAPVSTALMGYQFSTCTNLPTTSDSGDTSPTNSRSSLGSSYRNDMTTSSSSTSMRSLVPNFRYASNTAHKRPFSSISDSSEQCLPTSASASQEATAASLYSFSTDTGDNRSVTSSGEINNHSNGHVYAPSLRHSHPQHTSTSNDELRRQSSFDRQHRAQTA